MIFRLIKDGYGGLPKGTIIVQEGKRVYWRVVSTENPKVDANDGRILAMRFHIVYIQREPEIWEECQTKTIDMKPKECCNSKCRNIFYVYQHNFFMKDLCDECQDEQFINKEI